MHVHPAEKEAIKQIIIDTMPTVAAASGFIPKPDHTSWMPPILTQYPRRPDQAGQGISKLMQWLTSQGINHTYHQAKALQDHWIAEEFRAVSQSKEGNKNDMR